MKKGMMIALLAATCWGCGDGTKGGSAGSGSGADSIQALMLENEQLRQEQDDLLATLNEIEDGFREINEAQGRLTIDRRGEGSNARERIREDMQYIQETMAQNAQLIEKLRAQLKEGSRQADLLRHTIDNLTAQMEQKNAEISQLRQELEAKNIRIDELDEQVASLNDDLSSLQAQNEHQDRTISQQDRQLNMAWYCIGSKHELKEHNILKSGKVLQGDFEQSYFNEIDIRRMNQLNLGSKKVEILTTHPAGSYTLQKGDGGIYTLVINDYQQFWSTSKYLVVQTK